MSNIINVCMTAPDHFVVTDPDTGLQKVFSSVLIHGPRFIVDTAVKHFFCEEFPGKTDWECSLDARDRIRCITDFNCISDEIRW